MEIVNPQALSLWLERAVASNAMSRLGDAKEKVEVRVAPIVEEALASSDTWNALLGGRLREELGLEDPGGALAQIAAATVASLRTSLLDPSPISLGGLMVEAVRSSFQDVLNTSGASYESEGAHGVHEIPWLEWLLFGGDEVQVVGAFFHRFDETKVASRTDHALMVTRRSGLGSWSVPPEFEGVAEDNFIIRSVASRADDILRMMGEEVMGAFR